MANQSPLEKQFLDNDLLAVSEESSGLLFQIPKLDYTRFSKSFPYQLIMVEVGETKDKPTKIISTFTLPIPPQELSINMPIATTVQATLGGIVEQHGGIPFKDITFSGTTGVTPIKNTATGGDSFLDSVSGQGLNGNIGLRTGQAIFAGTTSAISRTITSGKALLGIRNAPNLNDDKLGTDTTDNNKIPEKSTGYAQFRLLERFLETYAHLKKKSIKGAKLSINGNPMPDMVNTKNLRLAFVIWKDETAYFCSGVQFNLKRSAPQSPMEYNYTLQLKAWQRVDLKSFHNNHESNQITSSKVRGPNYYTELMDRLGNVRDIFDGINDIGSSIILDVNNRLSEIARLVTLSLNSAISIADLPDTLKREVNDVLIANWNGITKQFSQLNGHKLPSALATHKAFAPRAPSVPVDSIPANVTPPKEIRDIHKLINPLALPLSPDLRGRVILEQTKAKALKRIDYEKMRDEVVEFSNNYADSVGAGGSTFTSTYRRPQVSATKKPTSQDYKVLFALNEMALILSHLAVSPNTSTDTPNTMEYVAGLAQRSGIAFRVPKSKFAVPFPYGSSLEKLAEIYLKDANRWHEIATLNGLKAPYVDEEGFALYFQTNGSGNTLYVSDASNLYLNQTVYISSNSVLRNKRHIIDIKQIYPNFVAVTVDGDNDLSNYKTVDTAKLEAFLPNTTNSQQIIYIPSEQDPAQSPEAAAVPGVNQYDPLLQVSGIDLLLKDDGDLAITNDGDCKMAYGLQNIVQTVKIAISTPQGSLIQHPGFGFDVPVGSSTADIDASTVLENAKSVFNNDPAFDGVVSASVQKQGPAAIITLVLKVKGLSQYLPITLRIAGN